MYVFDNDQQLDECCGCITTPDGLRTFSVTKDLTSNPLIGIVVNNGDVKIVSGAVNNSPCDPTANVTPTKYSPSMGDPHSEQGRNCVPDH